MKHGFSNILYNHRNKDETIISVIKRLFGDDLTSRLTRTQNRELSFRCIAYNMHRFTNLTIIVWFLQSHLVHDGLKETIRYVSANSKPCHQMMFKL
jgi:hypothetical protein